MSSKKESYWAKVLFREYTSHYITMTDEEIVQDVKQGIVALTRLDPSGNSFGSKMVGWAMERQEGKAARASAENGSLGGRPRIPPDAENGNASDDRKAPPSGNHLGSGKPGSARPAGGRTANSLQRNRRPESKEDFRHFVADQDLNISLAEDWYAIHEARGWTFEDGSPIMNWKGALKNYVTSREEDGIQL